MLKMKTARDHKEIEGAFSVMHENFTLVDYKNLLTKLYGFYYGIEKLMMESNLDRIIDLDYSKRSKIGLLKSDLEFFGYCADEISEIRKFIPWSLSFAEGQVLGVLYVLEGSTLGGQIITRHLREKFEFQDNNGLSFFNCYGSLTGKMWKEFQAVLDDHLNSTEKIQQAVDAAQTTFRELGRWLKSKKTDNYLDVNSFQL